MQNVTLIDVTSYYWHSIVTTAISCIISEVKRDNRWRFVLVVTRWP